MHVFTFGVTGWYLHLLCGQLSQHHRITLTFDVIAICGLAAGQAVFLAGFRS